MRKTWVFNYAQATAYYVLEDYENARTWFQKINMESESIPYYTLIDIRYQITVVYRKTGSLGKAVLMLRDLIFTEREDDTYSNSYLRAIVDLAAYYVGREQKDEADRILARLDGDLMVYAEELMEEELFILLADKSMLDCDIEQALHYYKKAFELCAKPEIEEKIRILEGGTQNL